MKELTPQNRQSILFDAVRFPLIYLVLIIHVLPPDLKVLEWKFTDMNLYTWISEGISHNYGRMAVPTFFVISGYFFFFKLKDWTFDFYSNQLRKRVKTLLVPFLLWNTLLMGVTLAVFYSLEFLGIQHNNTLEIFDEYNFFELQWMPIDLPLWYVRDLMCMALLSPVFYFFFRYLRMIGVLLITLFYLSIWEFEIPGFSSTAIYFFGIGAYWGIEKKNVLQELKALKWLSYILTPVLLLIATYYNGIEPYHEYVIRPCIIFSIVSFLFIMDSLLENDFVRQWCIRLSPMVFFVLAIHEFYIKNWLKGAFYRTPLGNTGWGMLLGYILMPLLAWLICVGIYKVWIKISPRTLGILTGDR